MKLTAEQRQDAIMWQNCAYASYTMACFYRRHDDLVEVKRQQVNQADEAKWAREVMGMLDAQPKDDAHVSE